MRAINKVYSGESKLIHENAIFIRLKVMGAYIDHQEFSSKTYFRFMKMAKHRRKRRKGKMSVLQHNAFLQILKQHRSLPGHV